MGINVLPIIEDMLAERRERKAQGQYQAKHGAGLETTEQMEIAAARQRHPSAHQPKHAKR